MNKPLCHKAGVSAQGFTLLEIVFVLGMIAMLAVWLTMSVTTVGTEQKLREASGSIEVMTKRARSIAVMQQRAYQVTISNGSVSMAPQYVSAEVETFEEDEGEEGASREDFEDVTANEPTDVEVTYEIRRWRSDTWEEIDGDKKVVLTVEPVGLVEPISIRCSMGKSWLIQDLHPLTGGVSDEEMSVQDE